jgi:protein-tyrosine phosphatase/membrane-associated phospholipid phosphatase
MTEPPSRPWPRALVWLLCLGPFFFASYGFATWVTSQRADVGVIVFAWERHIPFLPWTILPYWLIDLLYGLSLFLRPTKTVLDRHAQRLLLAQIIAVACFLLFPLRFSVERPAVDGLFGTLFALLGQFDKPFNQAPSLHIALMVLLWSVYLKDLPRAWRWPVHVTFALIGVSVLTTWQHHFIDVPTGLLLGWGCLWLLPDTGPTPLAGLGLNTNPTRRRLAVRYALGAGACALLAGLGGGWLWLLWPGLALALVAAAYLALGPGAFQKQADGRLSAAARALFAPYLLGARLNARAWTWRQPPAVEIAPGLLLGPLPRPKDLDRPGAAALLDLAAELPWPSRGRPYRNVPLLDLVPPSPEQIDAALQALEELRRQAPGPVLVSCALGLSRSALVAAAWLLAQGHAASPEAALEQVRRRKPGVVLGPAHQAALHAWWRQAGENPA